MPLVGVGGPVLSVSIDDGEEPSQAIDMGALQNYMDGTLALNLGLHIQPHPAPYHPIDASGKKMKMVN